MQSALTHATFHYFFPLQSLSINVPLYIIIYHLKNLNTNIKQCFSEIIVLLNIPTLKTVFTKDFALLLKNNLHQIDEFMLIF